MKLLTSEFGLNKDIQTKFVYQHHVGPNLNSYEDQRLRDRVETTSLSEKFESAHQQISTLDKKIDSDVSKLELLESQLDTAKSDKKEIRKDDTSERSDRKTARKNVRSRRREIKGLKKSIVKNVNQNQRAARKLKKSHARNLSEKQDRTELLQYRVQQLQELSGIKDTKTHSGIINRHTDALKAAIRAEKDAQKAVEKGAQVSDYIDGVINKCIAIEDNIRNERLPHKLWKTLGLTRKPKEESIIVDEINESKIDTNNDEKTHAEENSTTEDSTISEGNNQNIEYNENIEFKILGIINVKGAEFFNQELTGSIDWPNIKNSIQILLDNFNISSENIKKFTNKFSSETEFFATVPTMQTVINKIREKTSNTNNSESNSSQSSTNINFFSNNSFGTSNANNHGPNAPTPIIPTTSNSANENASTLPESESALYLNTAKDTPEFKWVTKQLIGKNLNLNQNDWNDIRKINRESLLQFRENNFDMANLIVLSKLGMTDKNDVKEWLNGTHGQDFLKSKYNNLSDYFVHAVETAKNGKGRFNEKAGKLLLNNGSELLNTSQANKLPGDNNIQKIYNLEAAGILDSGTLSLNNVEDVKIDPVVIALLKLPHAGNISLEELSTIKTAIDKNLIEKIGEKTSSNKFEITEGHSRIKQKEFSTITELTTTLQSLNESKNLYFEETSKDYEKLYGRADDPFARTVMNKLIFNKKNTGFETDGLGLDKNNWNNIKDINKDGFQAFIDADKNEINNEKWEMFKLVGFDQSQIRNFIENSELGKLFMNSKAATLAQFLVEEYNEAKHPSTKNWKDNLYHKETFETMLYAPSFNLTEEEIDRIPGESPIEKMDMLEKANLVQSGSLDASFGSFMHLPKKFWDHTLTPDDLKLFHTAQQADAWDDSDTTFYDEWNMFGDQFEVNGTDSHIWSDNDFWHISDFMIWLKKKDWAR